MKRLRNILWWVAFMICAIAAQAAVPGVDVLTAGLLLLLQERDYRNMLWLLPVFILLQEGMGTREFGTAIVWYATVILLFKIGRWLFEAENFVFIFLLSACLGAAYYGVAWLMAPLQDFAFNMQEAMNASLMQAIFLPLAWRLLVITRRWNTHVQEN
ncbi:MAG: hypothetical protein J6N67_03805 [Desulfovibrio sp.]|nr:hypothetical protein [Desulfovibrio sp.]MBO6171270.1 hypothetical protein [Desulfovibrio sp.]